MVARKHWLQIAGLAVLALAVGIGAVVYWSRQSTRPGESADTQKVQGRADGQSAVQLQAKGEPELVRTGDAQPNPEAEKLYQIALQYRSSGISSPDDYGALADCCQEILERYPNTLQAERAAKLLSKVRRDYLEQAEGMVMFAPTKRPEVKKSRPLRTRISFQHILWRRF